MTPTEFQVSFPCQCLLAPIVVVVAIIFIVDFFYRKKFFLFTQLIPLAPIWVESEERLLNYQNPRNAQTNTKRAHEQQTSGMEMEKSEKKRL